MELQDDLLCAACKQLGLASIFDPRRFDDLPGLDTPEGASAKWTRYIQHVGHWSFPESSDNPVAASCPFCVFVRDAVTRGLPAWSKKSRELLVFPSYLLYDFVNFASASSASQASIKVPTTTYLLIVNHQYVEAFDMFNNAESWVDWLRRVCHTPFVAASLSCCVMPHLDGESSGTPPLSASPKTLRDDRPDYQAIRQWLDICVARHGALCSPPSGPPVPRLKLIDCRTRRIINAEPGKKYDYVALSYVWGKKPPDSYDYPQLPESLPLVILDAMTVVLRLGLQYIWIDRYCIWQEDQVHKMSQVNKMDQVYGDAYLAIVACAGDDPSHGLPGHHTMITHRSFQDQREAVAKSVWKSRAWTYQEECLAPRKLYFTDYETSFECHGMMCFEHLALPLAYSSNVGLETQPFWNNKHIHNKPEIIWALVGEYSERQLTYQSDRINAIFGMFNAWSRLHPECSHYWGVPIVAAPSCWKMVDDSEFAIDMNKYIWQGGVSTLTRALLAGLYMWSEDAETQAGERPRHFPSWSWAGQGSKVKVGTLYHRGPTALARRTFEYDAPVWAERPDGTTEAWDKFCQYSATGRLQLPPATQWTPYLHIEGWVFKVGPFCRLTIKDEPATSNIFHVPATVAASSGDQPTPPHYREFKADYCQHPGPDALLTTQYEAITFEPPASARFALVLRGCIDQDSGGAFFERIGVLELAVWEIEGDRKRGEWKIMSVDDDQVGSHLANHVKNVSEVQSFHQCLHTIVITFFGQLRECRRGRRISGPRCIVRVVIDQGAVNVQREQLGCIELRLLYRLPLCFCMLQRAEKVECHFLLSGEGCFGVLASVAEGASLASDEIERFNCNVRYFIQHWSR
ncbi:heterokaryon incompatibility protein-domain-containing protein [Podospora didyma]|uniref:Heterokaryon incompatibility protein-domain-containing protein n=1 Tax=Podospora didyma TaxID=330526 RepID=A0AAE0NPH9_9PEZI|nr:heterokaryon incompatibility protein-domain-containing protein [Podospora didyma]